MRVEYFQTVWKWSEYTTVVTSNKCIKRHEGDQKIADVTTQDKMESFQKL